MRVLFVNPVTPPEIFKVQLSFGVAYLSSVLKKEGHKTSLLCPHIFNKIEIDKELGRFNPQLIAFSTVSDQFNLTRRIIDYIHEKYNLPIIIGGTHATVSPQSCIEIEGVTGVCIGEGEGALSEFIGLFEKGKDYTRTKNFWIRKGKKIMKNPLRPLLKDIDSLPFPDRELFAKYVDYKDEIEFMGSRGCPYQCSYCVNKVLQDKHGMAGFVRFRKVDRIIEEIKYCLCKYDSPRILFHDDTFTLNRRWLEEFADKYSKKIGKPFVANGRVETINKETIALLKKAGCIELKIGVESGSERIRREYLNRNMSNKKIIEAFKLCKRYGILVTSFNMIGIPGETEEDVKKTIALNRAINPFRMGVSIFKPYEGTHLYSLCSQKGWISKRQVVSYFEDISILDLPTLSSKKIAYYYKIFKLSVYHPFIAELAKLLIFLGIYDPIVGAIGKLRKFLASILSREQKEFFMRLLKI